MFVQLEEIIQSEMGRSCFKMDVHARPISILWADFVFDEPVFKNFPRCPGKSNNYVEHFRNHISRMFFLVENWEILKIENSNEIRY